MRGGVASFIVGVLLHATATAAFASAGWVSIPPDGADTLAIAFSRSEPGVVWAGTADGLYRSEDGGASWSAAGFAGLRIDLLAVHPGDGRHVWAVSSGSTVWRSDDGGATFARHDLEPATGGFQDLALDLGDPDTAYLTADRRLYVTRDGGATWTITRGPLGSGWYRPVLATPLGVFAGNSSGLYRSTDRGASWTLVGPRPYDEAGSLAADASGRWLWVLGYSGANLTVFTSSDGGQYWWLVAGGFPAFTTPTGPIAVSADASTALVRAGGRWFASADGGRTWTERGRPPSACAPASRLVFDPLGHEAILALVGGGVARSTDGGWTWGCVPTGMRNVTVTAIFPASDGSLWAATRDQGIYKSADGGSSWSCAGGSMPHGFIAGPDYSEYFTVLAFTETDGAVVAGTTGGAYLTADGGASWSRIDGIGGAVGAFLQDPGRSETLVASALTSGMVPGGLFVSRDGGSTWQEKLGGGSAAGIAADASSGALMASVWIPPMNGFPEFRGLVRSTDHGLTWTQANAMTELAMLVADPRVPGRIWAANGRILRSDDGGTSWSETGSPAPCGSYSSLCGPFSLLVDVANDRLLVAAYDWVYESLDDAATWRPLTPAVPVLGRRAQYWPALHLTSVPALAVDASGRLLAGTAGRGLFVLEPEVRAPRRRLSR